MLPYDAQGDQTQTLIDDWWKHILTSKNLLLKSLGFVMITLQMFCKFGQRWGDRIASFFRKKNPHVLIKTQIKTSVNNKYKNIAYKQCI